MPPRDGKRKLVPPEPSHSNPLLEMENLFIAPGEHVSQCRIKTGKTNTKTAIYYSSRLWNDYKRLQKQVILTGFEEKGNSYWRTVSVNSREKYHI